MRMTCLAIRALPDLLQLLILVHGSGIQQGRPRLSEQRFKLKTGENVLDSKANEDCSSVEIEYKRGSV